MIELAEIVEEEVGKKAYETGKFLQSIIHNGSLVVYAVETNKEIVLEDNEKERIVKTLKGTTLSPIVDLKYKGFKLLQNPDTGDRYSIYIGFFANEDRCSGLTIHKYSGEFDLQKIRIQPSLSSGAYDSNEEIARLSLYVKMPGSYKTDQEFLDDMGGTLTIKGEQDELFEKIHEFMRE